MINLDSHWFSGFYSKVTLRILMEDFPENPTAAITSR